MCLTCQPCVSSQLPPVPGRRAAVVYGAGVSGLPSSDRSATAGGGLGEASTLEAGGDGCGRLPKASAAIKSAVPCSRSAAAM